jgi:isoquinoline 1-oxidoreductase alpha subunit
VQAADADGAEVVTIEGLAPSGDHVLQKLRMEMNVPQCGYCQAGMLMAAADLLKTNARPSDEDIDAAMTNICRCGTYPRIRAAIRRASGQA